MNDVHFIFVNNSNDKTNPNKNLNLPLKANEYVRDKVYVQYLCEREGERLVIVSINIFNNKK